MRILRFLHVGTCPLDVGASDLRHYRSHILEHWMEAKRSCELLFRVGLWKGSQRLEGIAWCGSRDSRWHHDSYRCEILHFIRPVRRKLRLCWAIVTPLRGSCCQAISKDQDAGRLEWDLCHGCPAIGTIMSSEPVSPSRERSYGVHCTLNGADKGRGKVSR